MPNTMKRLGILASLLPSLAFAQAQTAQTAAGNMLIKNATVLTVTKGTLQNTDILVRNGKIAQIGPNLTAPAGAQVVDATGKYVMPGIIDPHSHAMSDATNEGSLSVTSMVRIADVLNPTDVAIYRALAGGVTTINVLHGSANTIGGQNAVVKLKWGRDVDQMMFPGATPGIKFALGENVTRKNSQQISIPGLTTARPVRYPTTRMGQEEVIRDAFTRARDYKAQWDDYRARVAKGDKTALAPRRDLELEPLVEVLEGKRFVHSHGYRADELLMLLNVAKEFGFTVKTLQHGLEGYKIASEIAQAGTGLSSFADEWSYKIEAYDAIPYNVAILTRHGVTTTINSDSDERMRRLNIDAAKLMRYGGLTEDEALKTITYNGAVQLGVQDKVGSIEVGKDADLAIFTAHPLSVYASVDKTIIDGEVFFDRQKDLADRDRLAKERADLEKAPENQAPNAGRRPPFIP
ncbi:amidohydrolase [Gemmatirosa kalamazoonensis]|uniref:Amidohydrolase n=1 Tax=Gemmatirosa kalamazoonensis TaxID=861299 RepID=W0RB16_9BACT|nr:amidohydrolase family protein [Gemmatirosa kalamazoonensis]AHG88274.1 amidohydrolase [Gemmatirosa kalamazoonensis]